MDARTLLPTKKIQVCLSSCISRSALWKLLQGSLLASALVYWIHLTVTTWGFSTFAMGSFALAAVLVSFTLSRPVPQWSGLLGNSGLLLLTTTSIYWWAGWDAFLARGMAHSTFGGWVSCGLNGSLLAAVGICLHWCLQSGFVTSAHSHRKSDSLATIGLAAGVWLVAGMFALFIPMYSLALLSCLLLLGGHLMAMQWGQSAGDDESLNESQQTAVPSESLLWNSLGIAFLAGSLLPVLYRIVCQLQPETAMLFYGVLASLLYGAAFSWRGITQFRILILTMLLAIAVAAFPLWMHYYMAISAMVSWAPAAVLLRQLGLLAFFFPAGQLLASALRTVADFTQTRSARFGKMSAWLPAVSMAIAISGYAFSSTLLTSSVMGPALMMSVCLGALVILSLAAAPWENRQRASVRWGSFALTIGACLGIAWTYQPELSAKALFSTRSFLAWRDGTPLSATVGLDDGRLLEKTESSQGTWTLWREQGAHYQLRLNGIPAGRISGDTRLVPQPTGGLLSAVLPLSLHSAPREILLIGLEAGTGLKTTLEFPVMQVTCVEQDQALIQQARTGALAATLKTALSDDRVKFVSQNPAAALRTLNQQYDVILETAGHSAIYRYAAQYEASHYRWVARNLSPEGLYCQRFIFTDYGPTAIRTAMETLQTAFGYVTAFDTAPGEMLLVAARSKENVLTANLLDRISAPQTRRTLAQLGWDWSVAMNLARFELADMQKIPSYGVQSISQGTGTFRLAYEMLRWGNKFEEVRVALADQPQRLLEHYQDEKQLEDVLARLADIVSRERLLVSNPDQFWVYRKTLKDRLIEKPRTVIQPVKGEGLQKQMHADDQRRLDYFEALGHAATQNPCPPAAIAAVESYATPYDPIISYFLHSEVARLYQRTEPAQPEQELAHWLHALYFGSQQERSVRGIHRSLELLCNAELSLTAAERYDYTNSLLELLTIRWSFRKGKQDISQSVLLLDVKDSLESAELGMAALEKFGAEAAISPVQTERRKQELERKLVRMLRSFRAEMLARASKPNPLLPKAE